VKVLKVVLVDWLTISLGFVSSQVWFVVLYLIGDVGAGEGWKFCIACLPPGHFFITALVCEVGASCIVPS
jgi:hypothetical protein